MRARDLTTDLGEFETGVRNKITDVPGVRVGHETVIEEGFMSGVTVVIPHGEDPYEKRVFAGLFVLNGFGKSTGLVQLAETGLIETPIAITGTLSVGIVFDDVVDHMLSLHPDLKTVNPVVLECNDHRLADPGKRGKLRGAFKRALENSSEDFELGCVGAGTGMVAFSLKSGIGSSSRIVGDHTIGALVVPNFGKLKDLALDVPKRERDEDDSGSIIVVLATDVPLTPRQLRRIAVRASHGIALTGGKTSHGSGDVILAFSNAVKIERKEETQIPYIDDESPLFGDLLRATIELTREAIIDALASACENPRYPRLVDLMG